MRWFGSAAAPAPCWPLVSAAMEVLHPSSAQDTTGVGVLGLSRQLELGCWGVARCLPGVCDHLMESFSTSVSRRVMGLTCPIHL